MDQFGSEGLASILITAICGAPDCCGDFHRVFAIFVVIVQWVAKMFGGRGTSDQLAYTIGAIMAPFSLWSVAS